MVSSSANDIKQGRKDRALLNAEPEIAPPVKALLPLLRALGRRYLLLGARIPGRVQEGGSSYRGRPETALLVIEVELGGVEELPEESVGDGLGHYLDARIWQRGGFLG